MLIILFVSPQFRQYLRQRDKPKSSWIRVNILAFYGLASINAVDVHESQCATIWLSSVSQSLSSELSPHRMYFYLSNFIKEMMFSNLNLMQIDWVAFAVTLVLIFPLAVHIMDFRIALGGRELSKTRSQAATSPSEQTRQRQLMGKAMTRFRAGHAHQRFCFVKVLEYILQSRFSNACAVWKKSVQRIPIPIWESTFRERVRFSVRSFNIACGGRRSTWKEGSLTGTDGL